VGISASTFYSLVEDKNTLQMGEKKTIKFIILLPLTNLLTFWILILYLCLNIQLEDSTIGIIVAAFIFSFIRTIASSLFISPLTKSLKKAHEINNGLAENKFSATDALEKLEEESDNMKRQMAKAILFAVIPALLGVFFIWIAFIRILIDVNAPIQLVLYAIFAVIIEIILSNFIKKLKKELINKVILNTNE
jgi:divalent metal cation (Fe/Co/Zn/Cd) transporter